MWWHFTGVLILINDASIYLAILLGQCTMLSFLLLALAAVLRKTVLKRAVFLRGMLWSTFLIVPFMGKLNLFYENRRICNLFMWWNDICMMYCPIRYGYLASMFICAGVMFYRRGKIHRMLHAMKKDYIGGQKILISEMKITPFVTGLFCARIVIPQIMIDNFKTEELEMVLLHEKTHIRLGHLWCYFFWDVIRILLWPNFLLTICMKDIREDMEDICDKVTIQRSGNNAYGYGKMLINLLNFCKKQPLKLWQHLQERKTI